VLTLSADELRGLIAKLAQFEDVFALDRASEAKQPEVMKGLAFLITGARFGKRPAWSWLAVLSCEEGMTTSSWAAGGRAVRRETKVRFRPVADFAVR